MIPFNIPTYIGEEKRYLDDVISNKRKLSGDGEYTRKCHKWLELSTGVSKALLTTSCTHALEIAALLCNIEPGDEVIAPSYTFVSTVNAFVLRGAKIIFVDIRPDTMNIDENLIQAAITPKTKAIVPVHYAGVSCEMDFILELAKANKIFVVEDAAQGVLANYKGKPLGSMGDFGCFSFHETKNYTMGEGGALLVRNTEHFERAEILREKGTNRSQFFRGQIDKYTWVDLGSSYLPGELNAAYLYAQLENAEVVNKARLKHWQMYNKLLRPLMEKGRIELPVVPKGCTHNGHLFYIKCANLKERSALIEWLKARKISAVFHYVPLHSSPAGRKFSCFSGEDRYTTRESERLLRLPLYYGISSEDVQCVVEAINDFYLK